MAARRTAVIRLGGTSVARMELERSVASTTAARPSGTATVRSGLAKASARAISARAYTTMGAWRRQPGRLVTTDGIVAGAANAAAALRRRRSSSR